MKRHAKTSPKRHLEALKLYLRELTDDQIDQADDAGLHLESQWVWELREMATDQRGYRLKKHFDSLYEQMSMNLLKHQDFVPIFTMMKRHHETLYC
ncbi:hypothetical protein F7U66_00300 [Vibrio parahaemolyticus]|nr:hypothetical protein [Vibrio parahaemolyticus]